MKRLIFTTLLSGFLGYQIQAQEFEYDWMKMITFDQELVDPRMRIFSDEAGNTYSTFLFQWDIHLGRPPGKKEPEPPTLSAEDALYGIYIDKRDPEGNALWAKVIRTGSTKKADELSALINLADLTAVNGNIYITGTFERTIDFGEDISLKSEGRSDMFIAKLDSNGKTQWAIRAGGSGEKFNENDKGGLSIVADKQGNVFATGSLNAYPKGGGSIGDQPLGLSKDGMQAVLIKLNAEGKVQWTKNAAAGTLTPNNDLSLDGNGNLYLSGTARFFVEWQGNKTVANGLGDAFILKLDKDANFVWSKVWGFGNGAFDGKTMDNEGVNRLSVSAEGRVTATVSLYDGVEVAGKKMVTGKDNPLKVGTLILNLDAQGNEAKATTFTGPYSGIPNTNFPGYSGRNGTIYFTIGGKANIDGQSKSGEGMYAINAQGELSYVRSMNIEELKGVHVFGDRDFTLTANGSLFGIGNVYLMSELASQYISAKAGQRLEKKLKKNYFYSKDFNKGVVIVKYSKQ
jgi:hypothetical protein